MIVNVEPIRTDEDLEKATERLFALRDFEEGTPEFDEWSILADLIEAYERRTILMGPERKDWSFAVYVETWGLKPANLIPALGSRGRVSEILNGKRPLSLAMVQALHEQFGMSLEVLMQFAKTQRMAG